MNLPFTEEEYYAMQDGDRCATEAEADQEYALNMGRANPDQAWILSNRDAWYPNPFYQGPPQPHPESDPEDFDLEPFDPRSEPFA